MHISERRPGTPKPALLPDRPGEKISFNGIAPTPATAIRPERIGKHRSCSSGRSDAKRDGQLVYAVHAATEPELAGRSGCSSHHPGTDCRSVKEDVSDVMLLRNVAEGDKAAMHILFARHRVRVYKFIRRMVRDPGIADDLVSQVFLDVWRSANRFESRAQVSTWLLSIARFKALSSLRERTHASIDQDDLCGIVDAGDTPEAALDRKQTSGALRACIDRLSPAHREIIDLIYYRENSVAEVSDILDIPHATVKSRMFYARKQLARTLVSAGLQAAEIRTNICM